MFVFKKTKRDIIRNYLINDIVAIEKESNIELIAIICDIKEEKIQKYDREFVRYSKI